MGESYRDLIAWRKAMELVTEIYRSTQAFPRDESMALRISCAEPPCRCPATSPRGRPDSPARNFINSLAMRGAPSLNWRRNS